jgi:hypothetical protein
VKPEEIGPLGDLHGLAGERQCGVLVAGAG